MPPICWNYSSKCFYSKSNIEICAISRDEYVTFAIDFLHNGAVKMPDINCSCSLGCVVDKYATPRLELFIKVFLQ